MMAQKGPRRAKPPRRPPGLASPSRVAVDEQPVEAEGLGGRDALREVRAPAQQLDGLALEVRAPPAGQALGPLAGEDDAAVRAERDRKSTRLNSSHGYISYAVFCLK